MPLTAWGDFTIAASLDAGPLVPNEGDPVTVTWPLQRHVPYGTLKCLPYALLIVLLLLKANRNLRAWIAALPVAVVSVPLLLIPEESALPVLFARAIALFLLAITLVWLASHWFVGRNRLVVFLLAMFMMLVPGACEIGLRLLTAPSMRPVFMLDILPFLDFHTLEAAAFPVAMAGAGYLCRKRYTPMRFRLWLLASLPVACFLVMGAWTLAMWAAGHGYDFSPDLLPASLTSGAYTWVLSVFYVILLSRNSVYRARFRAIFRLADFQS